MNANYTVDSEGQAVQVKAGDVVPTGDVALTGQTPDQRAVINVVMLFIVTMALAVAGVFGARAVTHAVFGTPVKNCTTSQCNYDEMLRFQEHCQAAIDHTSSLTELRRVEAECGL